MTAEQIRQIDIDDARSTNYILREIAAQLAELNERQQNEWNERTRRGW